MFTIICAAKTLAMKCHAAVAAPDETLHPLALALQAGTWCVTRVVLSF